MRTLDVKGECLPVHIQIALATQIVLAVCVRLSVVLCAFSFLLRFSFVGNDDPTPCGPRHSLAFAVRVCDHLDISSV
jgi:hypothetical protein